LDFKYFIKNTYENYFELTNDGLFLKIINLNRVYLSDSVSCDDWFQEKQLW